MLTDDIMPSRRMIYQLCYQGSSAGLVKSKEVRQYKATTPDKQVNLVLWKKPWS